jgi:hypothetical protein
MISWPHVHDVVSAIWDWKVFGDTTSLMLLAASLADWLPPIAAFLSIVWVLIRIYETATVQSYLYGKCSDHENT